MDNKVRLEYHSALVGLLLGNLMEEAHKVYKWGIVAMTTKQFTSWALHCTTAQGTVKAWVLNRNTFSSIDAVLCDTCNFLIHSINALIKLDTILNFMLNDVTLRCAIN